MNQLRNQIKIKLLLNPAFIATRVKEMQLVTTSPVITANFKFNLFIILVKPLDNFLINRDCLLSRDGVFVSNYRCVK